MRPRASATATTAAGKNDCKRHRHRSRREELGLHFAVTPAEAAEKEQLPPPACMPESFIFVKMVNVVGKLAAYCAAGRGEWAVAEVIEGAVQSRRLRRLAGC